MDNPELITWLRDHSSGHYRPSAEAADRFQIALNLLEALVANPNNADAKSKAKTLIECGGTKPPTQETTGGDNRRSKDRVESMSQALEYMVECTLATIDDYAMKSKPPTGEFKRQVQIAQNGMDWLKKFNAVISRHGRVFQVAADHNENVTSYAKTLRKKWHPDAKAIF